MMKVENYRFLNQVELLRPAALAEGTMAYHHPVDYHLDLAQYASAMT
jgi:hypothetical protein